MKITINKIILKELIKAKNFTSADYPNVKIQFIDKDKISITATDFYKMFYKEVNYNYNHNNDISTDIIINDNIVYFLKLLPMGECEIIKADKKIFIESYSIKIDMDFLNSNFPNSDNLIEHLKNENNKIIDFSSVNINELKNFIGKNQFITVNCIENGIIKLMLDKNNYITIESNNTTYDSLICLNGKSLIKFIELNKLCYTKDKYTTVFFNNKTENEYNFMAPAAFLEHNFI